MRHGPIALLAALLLAGLLARDAWPPDETRNADVARAMSAGGGWLVPILHDEVYGEKPPLFFWLAAGLARLGVPLQAAPRAVAGLAALATLLLLPALAAGLGLPRGAVSRAGWLLASSPLFLVYAQFGIVDTTATAFVTGAIAAKLARHDQRGGARRLLVVLEGAALAAALLSKGPVLLLFPLGLRLGAALAREHSAASADASDLAALGVALGASGGWLLAAGHAEGSDYARAITLRQAWRRISGKAPHLRPPGFLLGITLIGLLPWALLGAPFGRRPKAGPRGTVSKPRASRAALLGWIALPALLLSLLRTQQPHYLLPALPAFALLLAQAVARPERWATRSTAALALLLSAALLVRAGSTAALTSHPAEIAMAADTPVRMAAALAAALLLALALLPRAARFPPWQRAAAGSLVMAVASLVALVRLDPWISPRALLSSPAVLGAGELAGPRSVHSSVRIFSGRSQVEVMRKSQLGAWLAADPGRVALVRESDLLGAGSGAAALREAEPETIGRGYLIGRPLLALRAARVTATGSDRIR